MSVHELQAMIRELQEPIRALVHSAFGAFVLEWVIGTVGIALYVAVALKLRRAK